MNIYLIGVIISMVVYIVVGTVAGKKVKNVDDYYVAGRKAPTILIVGSLVASFLSTGAFLGDTGEVYNGFFIPIVIVGVMQGTGYLFGSTAFGRYIRRSEALTLSAYFGKRFANKKIQRLAGVITVVAVTAYMLSAMQGISTLMSSITGMSYTACVIIAWISFAMFTIWSGSSGVLITDTIMFLIFLSAAIIGIPYIVSAVGGWFPGIEALATSITKPGIISAGGNLDYMYSSGTENLVWAVTYGLVWALVVMVSPWQTSRYLMAKDEKTVLKSAIWSSVFVIIITTLLYFSAAFVQKINPDLEGSQNLIWAAMNLMPKLIAVVFLAGILAAGISSASTFLSLIGFSITNDIMQIDSHNVKKQLTYSRTGMVVASVIVLILAYFNPPQIFWIMYFGGTVIASSWAIVSLASVWSKKLSFAGAYLSMLLGFLGCVVSKTYTIIMDITLPVWLDPFFIGIVLSVIGAIIGSNIQKKSEAEKIEHTKLFESQEKYVNVRKYGVAYIIFAALFFVFMLVCYAIPYANAIK
ncbi:MAG: sodium:solute symporter family protein [Clostridia bacterium]|nr:sodium:solute symporter family protein [Clostridia bacterium]